MTEKLAFATLLATMVTSVAYCEYRYKLIIDRIRSDRLAIARARDRIRGTAEEQQILRETRLQHALQKSTAYVISVSILCVGLLLAKVGMLPS